MPACPAGDVVSITTGTVFKELMGTTVELRNICGSERPPRQMAGYK